MKEIHPPRLGKGADLQALRFALRFVTIFVNGEYEGRCR